MEASIMRRISIGAAAVLGLACVSAAVPTAAEPAYDREGAPYYRHDEHRVRHLCAYESGWHGRGSYWCGYAWRRGYGWAGDNASPYGSDHYRGYVDDGAGHRYYDRGGYGVGHFDYGQRCCCPN
jgi:hypothetical protein